MNGLSLSFVYSGVILISGFVNSCTNIDFKQSFVSANIKDSKFGNVFLSEYKISSITLTDSLDFNYNEIWIERRWINSLDNNGREKMTISDSAIQLIMNFKDEHIFEKDKYWDSYTIRDENGNVMGSDKGLLFLELDNLYPPHNIHLSFFKVQDKFKPNLDSVKIGELFLSRK